jgi:putative ABC transport system permease protein
MTSSDLVLRGLRHYWRTNLAVIAGVATAVAVLAGALLVGDSVRGSLRDLVLQRLGRTDRVVMATTFFREALADDLKRDPLFAAQYADVAPIIAMQGLVTEQGTGRRASRVQVYGVDDRFWKFHDLGGRTGPASRDAFISRALATDIGAADEGTVLVRIERPSAIPIESLHGQKEDPGRTLRLTVRGVLDRPELGEFSIRPQQGDVRAVFVPLERLQKDLEQPSRVNALLVSDRPGAGASLPRQSPATAGLPRQSAATAGLPRQSAEGAAAGQLHGAIAQHATLEDYGLSIRMIDAQQAAALEASAGLLDRRRASAADEAAANAGVSARPVLTYLANTLRSGDRQVPYSLVTATDLSSIAPRITVTPAAGGGPLVPPIVINDWTARELAVKVGDPLTLDYFVWQDPGYLETRSADFQVAAIVPIAGAAADRDLAPVYPGITGADTLADWDPPFPIDLKRVRPVDEEYWKEYRTIPKAFIAFQEGQRLWQSRYGDRTSVRISAAPGQSLAEARDRFVFALRSRLDPASMGFSIRAVRGDGLSASRGSTDFGEYFVYFSFFLVASALVLAALFFRLGVEQRAREVGLLRAVGFSTPRIRRLFAAEGLLLAAVGSVVGTAGAVAYGAAMMAGLRTWWSGAVGTTALTLHVSPISLAAGALGAIAAAMGCIWWTLRGFARISERSLLAGSIVQAGQQPRRSRIAAKSGAVLFAVIGLGLIAAAAANTIDRAGAFFGAGAAILIACLCLLTWQLAASAKASAGQARMGIRSIARLGFRNATERPGRSVLAIAVIASATFILISVDAFRRGDIDPSDRRAGTGGYPVLVDLMLPVVHDPNSRDGRDVLGLPAGGDIAIEPFRVLPGDDTSCLNLYEPTSPRILGVSRRFIDAGRFSFQASLASSAADRANPWRLLAASSQDGTVPVAADANSLTYVLHKKLGDEILLTHGDRPVRLKVVAALADSVFQGELLMSEQSFTRLFPEQQGYRFLMIDVPAAKALEVSAAIERGAGDFGADAIPTAQRLAEFHAVENTYLSTFQTLGGLGLLVGTVGLAAVLLRNVLERRRELALLRAVGYGRSHLFAIILSENAVLLGWGLAAGAISALVAIAPAALERGARLPLTAGGWSLLVAVLVAGLVSSVIATRAALRAPLIAALRAE